ncbi:calcium-binding protein, partial [Yoonia sp. I 8.24]|uniref:calcium-binding protein n=1 Tax=Yoonia sp. I 8.24 TaxID=1537229 RepID=UPI001EE12226
MTSPAQSAIQLVISQLDEAVALARAAGYDGLADAIYDTADFLITMDGLEGGLEAALIDEDQNEGFRVLVETLISVAAGVGASVVIGSLLAPVMTFAAGSIVIGGISFVAGVAVGSVIEFLGDSGITPVGKIVDASDLPGPKVLIGTIVGDEFITTQQDDTVRSNGGDDTIKNVGGSDIIDGGSGYDTVSYQQLAGVGSNGIVVDNRDLSDGVMVQHGGESDTLIEVEAIIGTDRADAALLGAGTATTVFDDDLRSIDLAGGDDVVFLHNEGTTALSVISVSGGAHIDGDLLVIGTEGATAFTDLQGGTVRYSTPSTGDASFNIDGFEHVMGNTGDDHVTGSDAGNTIYGYEGEDRIDGGDGDDIINGGNDDDDIDGGANNDIIEGGLDDDRLHGGSGNDLIFADSYGGTDSSTSELWGDAGSDILVADAGSNTLNGGADADILIGGDGSDVLNGGDGNDLIITGGTGDIVDGGAGDTWVVATAGSEAIINFDGSGGDMYISGLESGVSEINLVGLSSDDVELVWSYTYTGEVDGSLELPDEYDFYEFPDISETKFLSGDAYLRVKSTGALIYIGTVTGEETTTIYSTGHGPLEPGEQPELYEETELYQTDYSAADVTLTNGQLTDIIWAIDLSDASYPNPDSIISSVTDDLSNDYASTITASTDEIDDILSDASIEILTSGPFGDIDTGSGTGGGDTGDGGSGTGGDSGSGTGDGDTGDGIVTGTGSADIIDGSFTDADGDAIDDLGQTIDAGAGDDTVVAGAGNDTVLGGTGNDTLTGGAGLDTFTFISGDGTDTITDFDPAEDVISIDAVVISDLGALPTGVTGATVGTDFVLSYGSGDQITIVTNTDLEAAYPDLFGEQSDGIVTGTGSGDVIDGSFIDADGDLIDDLGQTIDAGAGDDTVVAGAGNDTVLGGTDNDTLTGGAGLDTFTFASGDGTDTITDFDPAEDVISIDAVVISDLGALPAGVTGSSLPSGAFVLSYGTGDQITIEPTSALVGAYPSLFVPDNGRTVTGSSTDDVIDSSFVDADGDIIDDLGQTIDAGSGNDTISAGLGNDTITAGDGDDTIIYSGGDDVIAGNLENFG